MNMRSEWTHVPPTDAERVDHAADHYAMYGSAECWCEPSRSVPPTDVATIAAEAVRMDALVAALVAECAKGEAREGWVSCRVLRRLLGEVQ